MKKGFEKGFLALALSLIMLVGLAGCTNNTNTADTGTAKDTSSGQNTNTADTGTAKDTTSEQNTDDAAGTTSGVVYPIATDNPVTLDYYFWLHGAALQFITSNAENLAWQQIEEKTGVKINWIHPVIGQEGEQFATMLASQKLPDLLGDCWRYPGGIIQGVEDGAYIDLSNLLPVYAPDYYAHATANDDIKREFTSEDGRFLMFGAMRTVDTPADPPWCRPNIREDWLNEFGMEIPATYDELAAYFEAVKTQKNVTPFSFFPIDSWMNEIFMGGYDVLPGFMVKDSVVTHGRFEEGYREYLAMLADWYAKGYISPDFATPFDEGQDFGQLAVGQLGCAVGSTDVMYNFVKEGVQAVSIPYPRKEKGQQIHTAPRSNYFNGWETAVSAQSKHPEVAVQFMNYLFSDEGSHIINYGPEGVTHTMENGEPKFTEAYKNPENYTSEAAGYIMRAHFATKKGVPDLILNRAMGSDFTDALDYRARWGDDPAADSIYHIPPINLTVDESNERATLMTDIDTYINEISSLFISGERDINGSDWDAYIEAIKSMGIERAIEITQQAYNRYIGN